MFKYERNKRSLKPLPARTWVSLLLVLILTWLPKHALSDTDLSELGFEIFIDDPAAKQKKEETVLQNKMDELPDFIDPEVWKEDLELDAPQVEPPKEPSWQGIYKQADLTDIGAESCCLRAARASRYRAETACLALNNKVWEMKSVMPEQTEQPDAKLGNCLVYQQTETLEDEQTNTYMSPSEDEPSRFELDPYRCIARAMAKCYSEETSDN